MESSLSQRLLAVANDDANDIDALIRARNLKWLSASDKRVLGRIIDGEEMTEDWFRIRRIANSIEEQEES